MSVSHHSSNAENENNPTPLTKIAAGMEKIVRGSALIFCWSYGILIFAILGNVVLRYGFGQGMIVFEEIQWHLYAIGMMFGLSYAEITNSQVRVDLVADRLRRRTVLKWEVFGSLVFVLPFIYVILVNGYDYVLDSYRVNEASSSPLGLPFRWAIKAVIPISFVLLALAVISRMLNNINTLLSDSDGE